MNASKAEDTVQVGHKSLVSVEFSVKNGPTHEKEEFICVH